jgi:predicted esterase
VAAPGGEEYALYLPSAYDPARRWPVIYLLDARGRALTPMERFQAAAERYGYVLASTYGSASDVPMEGTVRALQETWNDTHRRLALDERRAALAGFSGTVRAACVVAAAAPGHARAVVGSGGGFPLGQAPTARTPFAFFGAAGNRDFNHGEMQRLADQLSSLGLPHRNEVFEGGHQWLPEALALRAVEWLELLDMRAGARPRDEALIAALWERDAGEARAAAAGGDAWEAERRFRALAADFDGLRVVEGARAEAAALARSEAWKKASRRRAARLRREDGERARAQAVVERALREESVPMAAARLASDLRLDTMKRRAEARDDEGDLHARVLAWLSAQTGFYLPRLMAERGEHRKAALLLEVATVLRPESADLRYELAAALARDGSEKRALGELERAVEMGFADAARLRADEAFARLRGGAAFQRLLQGIPRARVP